MGTKGSSSITREDTYTDACESPYTASKIGGEAMVKAYQKCYSIDTSLLRFSNVYGRYDRSNRVVPLFIAQAARGQDLTVYGADKVLDFTYIDDCVAGLMEVIDSFEKVQGTTLNIASGEGTSLLELARFVVDQLTLTLTSTWNRTAPAKSVATSPTSRERTACSGSNRSTPSRTD